jgi:hypothetical protein
VIENFEYQYPRNKRYKTGIFPKKQAVRSLAQIQIAAQEFKPAQTHSNKKNNTI